MQLETFIMVKNCKIPEHQCWDFTPEIISANTECAESYIIKVYDFSYICTQH